MTIPRNIYFWMTIENDWSSCIRNLPICDQRLSNMKNSVPTTKIFFWKDNFFCQIQQKESSITITRQKMIVLIGVSTDASNIWNVNSVLTKVLLDRTLIVTILLLLLNVKHSKIQFVKDGLSNHISNERIRLRKNVLSIFWIADIPFVQLDILHYQL